MFSFRRKRKVLPAARLPVKTERAIGVILTTVESEVVRTLDEEGAGFVPVTQRDVLEGRLQSDSFYDAETEKLPTPALPMPALSRPPSSISPFVVSRVIRRPKTTPPKAPPAKVAPPPATTPPPRRATSRLWALSLFMIGCSAAFALTMLTLRPRRVATAEAPPAAVSVVPAIADAGTPR
jgi:hypothetical protein